MNANAGSRRVDGLGRSVLGCRLGQKFFGIDEKVVACGPASADESGSNFAGIITSKACAQTRSVWKYHF